MNKFGNDIPCNYVNFVVITMKLIRTKFKSGERYSLLVDDKGMPIWYPTLFATSKLRNSAKAPNTIEAHLNAIKLLIEWSHSSNIVLEEIFSAKQFLTTEQIEHLCIYLKGKKDEKIYEGFKSCRNQRKELHRAKIRSEESISSSTAYIRISYVANYIDWLAKHVISERNQIINSDISLGISRMVRSLKARRPTRSISSRNPKKGLADNQRDIVLRIINPNSIDLPFSTETKERDSLIFEILYKTGIRLGELLSIKISDFNFQNNTLHIHRRHDDVYDPRLKQPVAKTFDRLLPISRKLAERTHDYILRERSQVVGANKHDFLFVTYKSGPYCGKPLSSSGLYKIINQVRESIDDLSDLTPHIFRHTWNDMFSEKVDEQGISEAEEEKLRSNLMGWAEGSGTSKTYTQRHIEKKAHQVSILLQKEIDDGINKNK
ncbi:tyrosine-type recombinase/integrase (plasmid) [Acinetobacter baumannii]|uniref:tyrosine-type recombinase/integrase n=1 Tax=Acinetobacter TaxID=469 RepID=UPI001C554678|nr:MULTISPECIES: tyrosine-type recombinase/integrase [Acinetobacter]MDP7812960.1 tyrosine-type recombinase/integrase [Acinetobacter pittii]